MKKIKLKYYFIVLLSFSFLFVNDVLAKITDWKGNLNNVESKTQYSKATEGSFNEVNIAEFIGKIIWMGPFLGIPFMIQLVTAGYEWMSAAGDAKKVDDAKKRIKNAIIGLILFISLYVLAVFIIKSLQTVSEYPG